MCIPRNAQECDGGLRKWLLTTVVVTAICGVLGAAFHGKGDGTRPSRFLDDDDDDVWGVDHDVDSEAGVSVSVNSGVEGGGGAGLASTGNNSSSSGGEGGGFNGATPALKAQEEGRAGRGQGARRGAAGAEAAKGATTTSSGGPVLEGEPPRRDSMGEDSIIS